MRPPRAAIARLAAVLAAVLVAALAAAAIACAPEPPEDDPGCGLEPAGRDCGSIPFDESGCFDDPLVAQVKSCLADARTSCTPSQVRLTYAGAATGADRAIWIFPQGGDCHAAVQTEGERVSCASCVAATPLDPCEGVCQGGGDP